jgi:hypothetical protein
MLEAALLVWLAIVSQGSDQVGDPILAGWVGRSATRDLECERLDQAEAHRRYPAEVPVTPMKLGTLVTRDAVVCRRMVVPWRDRPTRDGVLLAALGTETTQIAGAVVGALESAGDAHPRTRVFVDAFHPDARMAQKIARASRHALAERGLMTMDLAPLVAAADVDVMADLSFEKALAVGCARLRAEGTLGDDDVLVGVALLREQETTLHAGLCRQGRWSWLR